MPMTAPGGPPLPHAEFIAEAIESRLHDLREANAQLVITALAAQELEAHAAHAHRQQIRFLAMVAHELRNPITPIKTVALLLNHAGIDKTQLAHLQAVIERQVTHLSRLIDDLLDGSRVSAGKFKLERRTIDLCEVLASAIQMCKPAMDQRQQSLIERTPQVPVWVNGDPVRLAQVFSNLLDNASKYTQDGGEIQLVVAVLEHTVVLKVIDNGIGISAEALPHIFDLFVQDTSSFAQDKGGLGIGLAVARDLVASHDGSIVAASMGRSLGSELVVTLPRYAAFEPA